MTETNQLVGQCDGLFHLRLHNTRGHKFTIIAHAVWSKMNQEFSSWIITLRVGICQSWIFASHFWDKTDSLISLLISEIFYKIWFQIYRLKNKVHLSLNTAASLSSKKRNHNVTWVGLNETVQKFKSNFNGIISWNFCQTTGPDRIIISWTFLLFNFSTSDKEVISRDEEGYVLITLMEGGNYCNENVNIKFDKVLSSFFLL